jgi:hypothetical protein
MLSLFLVFLLLILTVKFRFEIFYSRDESGSFFQTRLCLGSLRLPLPAGLFRPLSSAKSQKRTPNILNLVSESRRSVRIFARFIQEIHEFDLSIILGTGDSFLTAVGCGGLWSVCSPIMAVLQQKGKLNCVPRVDILPDYSNVRLTVKLHCIFQFLLGQIIIDELYNMGTFLAGRRRTKET